MYSKVKNGIYKELCNANTTLLAEITNSINSEIDDEKFANKFKVGEKAFSRNRFFTIRLLLVFLMTNLQKAIQRELFSFTESMSLSVLIGKSAFCKARKKLNPLAFCALSHIIIDKFYRSNEVQLWKGHRILAIDGSNAEIPNSKEIKGKFGIFKTRDDGKVTCMMRMLLIYDSINHITVHGSMDTMDADECSMLWACLPKLQLDKDDLLICDRYYASYALLFYLNHRDVQFCFRMKKCWNVVKTFIKSGKDSDVIFLVIPPDDRVEVRNLGISKTKLKCRLTKVILTTGEIEILLSSLIDEQKYSVADTAELYWHRWPIEEDYKTFKHTVCIENFSSKSITGLEQDFYVKIFIMNMASVTVRPINAWLRKKPIKKLFHQVNMKETIASLKTAVVSFFVANTFWKTARIIYEKLLMSTEAIRPGRIFIRSHQPKRKYYMCYKPV